MKSPYYLAQITGSDSWHVALFLLPSWNFACESQQEYLQQGLGHHLWPTLVKMFLCRRFVFGKHWNLWGELLPTINNSFKDFFVTFASGNVDLSTFWCWIHPTPLISWKSIYRGGSGCCTLVALFLRIVAFRHSGLLGTALRWSPTTPQCSGEPQLQVRDLNLGAILNSHLM